MFILKCNWISSVSLRTGLRPEDRVSITGKARLFSSHLPQDSLWSRPTEGRVPRALSPGQFGRNVSWLLTFSQCNVSTTTISLESKNV
jgi:hypothetical protein